MTRPEAGRTNDIVLTIAGTNYGFDLAKDIFNGGYLEMDISQWSPRVAAGGLDRSQLRLWSTVSQSSWHHGFGFPQMSDEAGFSHSDQGPGTQGSHVDTRWDGYAQIFTEMQDPGGTHPTVTAANMAASDSYIHAALNSSGGHVRYTNAAWDQDTDMGVGSAQTANDVLVVGDRVFVSIDTNRLQVSIDEGAAWANAGNATNPPNNIGAMAVGGGRMWGVEDGRNELHYSSAVDGSDWEGSGDANEIIVGPGVEAVSDILWWNGKLYCGRPDDLYMVDQNDVAHGVGLGFSYNTDNFREMIAGPDGYLWFLNRNKIFRWAGSRLLIDMTPPAISVAPPYAKYGDFTGLFTHDGKVYVSGRITYGTMSNETKQLLCWTGGGWHALADLTGEGSGSTVTAMLASNRISRIVVSATDAGSTVDWHEFDINPNDELPFAQFQTSGNCYLYSSRIALGLLEIIKNIRRLRGRGYNVDSGTTIVIQYQGNDDGSWRTLATINSTGITTSANLTADNEYNWVQMRFNFTTDTAGDTPIIDWYAIDMIARPTTVYGYQIAIEVGDFLETRGGTLGMETTGRDIRLNLRAARDDATPITLITPWSESVTVWVTAYRMINLERNPGEAPRGVIILSLGEL